MAKKDNLKKKNLINSGISALISTMLISMTENFFSISSFVITFIILFMLSFGIHYVLSKFNFTRRFYAKNNLLVLSFVTYYLFGLIMSLFAFSIGGFNGMPIWMQLLFIPVYALISPIKVII